MATDANSIFAAALPEPYVVLGLKLKPFSLGHYITLRRHGCAFVDSDKASASRDDIIFACLVCSMTYDGFAEWLERPPLSGAEKAMEFVRLAFGRSSIFECKLAMAGDRCKLDVFKWGKKIGRFSLKEKAELFKRYLDECCEEPKYWVEHEAKHESGAHWAATVIATLTGQLGFTRDQALNMPLREALLYFFMHAESLGAVRLMTDSEIKEVCGP